jgi:hypothetical protein
MRCLLTVCLLTICLLTLCYAASQLKQDYDVFFVCCLLTAYISQHKQDYGVYCLLFI